MEFGKSETNFDSPHAESCPNGRRNAEPMKLPALFLNCMHCRLNWPENVYFLGKAIKSQKITSFYYMHIYLHCCMFTLGVCHAIATGMFALRRVPRTMRLVKMSGPQPEPQLTVPLTWWTVFSVSGCVAA